MLEQAAARRYLKLIGSLLSVAGLTFVAVAIYERCKGEAACTLVADWKSIAFALAIFFCGTLLLSVSWSLLVWREGASQSRFDPAHIASHLTAQIAKYIPGNIFQFALRHGGSRLNGARHDALLSALMTESVLLVSAAVAVVAVYWTRIGPAAERLELRIGIAVAVVLAMTTAAWYLRRRSRQRGGARKNALLALLASLACIAAYFACAGVAFAALLEESVPGLGLAAATGCFAFSWVCGYLVPGAPGGLGVRESILLISISALSGGVLAVSAVVTMRGVTVLADVLGWLLGLLLRPRDQSQRVKLGQ